jgi:hypothetical protein
MAEVARKAEELVNGEPTVTATFTFDDKVVHSFTSDGTGVVAATGPAAFKGKHDHGALAEPKASDVSKGLQQAKADADTFLTGQMKQQSEDDASTDDAAAGGADVAAHGADSAGGADAAAGGADAAADGVDGADAAAGGADSAGGADAAADGVDGADAAADGVDGADAAADGADSADGADAAAAATAASIDAELDADLDADLDELMAGDSKDTGSSAGAVGKDGSADAGGTAAKPDAPPAAVDIYGDGKMMKTVTVAGRGRRTPKPGAVASIHLIGRNADTGAAFQTLGDPAVGKPGPHRFAIQPKTNKNVSDIDLYLTAALLSMKVGETAVFAIQPVIDLSRYMGSVGGAGCRCTRITHFFARLFARPLFRSPAHFFASSSFCLFETPVHQPTHPPPLFASFAPVFRVTASPQNTLTNCGPRPAAASRPPPPPPLQA